MEKLTEPGRRQEGVPEPEAQEMSFWDHLGELRRRILWAVVGILGGCLLAATQAEWLVDEALLHPARQAGLALQNLRPFGMVMLYIKVVLVAGLIVGMPFALYQLWRFVAPGLYAHERRWVRQLTLWTSLCFLLGVAFAYWVLLPGMLRFAAGFSSEHIRTIVDVTEYYGFVTTTLLVMGVVFELPVLLALLAWVGIVRAEFLRRYRRHAIVLILIIAAVLTPTPDPVNQLIFAFPLWVLYELGILVVRLIERRRG
ncbi:Sec-independent protein translocase protein TatC [bacterium HR21]|jgi:sec-independent protein translocase protein TatC|nr:Sec-independent protein translocase protein TatC [bacterium HR21]